MVDSNLSDSKIRDEMRNIFTSLSVYEVKPFRNKEHLAAWVTIEEDKDIEYHIGKEIRDNGYYIANHESESRYEDKNRNSYLIILEEY